MKQIIHRIQSIMRISLIVTACMCMVLVENVYASENRTTHTHWLCAKAPYLFSMIQQRGPTCAHTIRKSEKSGQCCLLLGVLGMTGLTWLSMTQGWSSRVTFALAADAFLLCFGIAAMGLYVIEKQKKHASQLPLNV